MYVWYACRLACTRRGYPFGGRGGMQHGCVFVYLRVCGCVCECVRRHARARRGYPFGGRGGMQHGCVTLTVLQ